MSGYNVGPRVALSPRFASAALALSGCDLSNTADEAYFDIPFKCRVVYAACLVTTIVAGDAVIKFDRRVAASNDTGRTDGTIANITLPDTTAISQLLYDKAALCIDIISDLEIIQFVIGFLFFPKVVDNTDFLFQAGPAH